MKTREFSNEFSSPDGIRTHDLFLEGELARERRPNQEIEDEAAPDQPETRGRWAPYR